MILAMPNPLTCHSERSGVLSPTRWDPSLRFN